MMKWCKSKRTLCFTIVSSICESECELGNLLYREEHYSSTDVNGQVTIKIGDGLYLNDPITNFNQINWATGK